MTKSDMSGSGIQINATVLSRKDRLAIQVTALVFIIISLIVTLSPKFVGSAQCPSDTIVSVSDASVFSYMAMLSLCIVCGTLALNRYGRFVPAQNKNVYVSAPRKSSNTQFYLMIVGTLCLIAPFWVNSATSYHCIVANGIISREGFLSAANEIRWIEADAVIAECQILRKAGGAKISDFRVRMNDHFYRIPLNSLAIAQSTSNRLTIPNLKKTLSPSVTETFCPDDIYSFFQEWYRLER